MQGLNLAALEEVSQEIDRIAQLVETGLIDAGEQAGALANRYPDSFEAQMFRGFVCNRQRDFTGALESLHAAIAIRPDNDAVHFNLGVTHCQFGDLEAAVGHFERAAKTAPAGRLQPLILYAACRHRLGDPKGAIPSFRQAVEAQPSEASAMYCLMQALRDTGAFAEADTWATRLAEGLANSYPAVRALLSFFQGYDFDGWVEVDDKALLTRHIADYRAHKDPGAFSYFPDTFVMPDDVDALSAAHHEAPGFWISKPNNMHNGHGLRIVDTPTEVTCREGWIAQRYLPKPFLFRGRKASFRLNMLVTSAVPPRIYLFRGGSVRFALDSYDEDPEKFNQLERHIGHFAIFGERKDLIEETSRLMGADNCVWRFPQMTSYIEEAGFDNDALWSEIEIIAREIVGLCQHIGLFERQAAQGCRFAYGPKILGFDIFLDEGLKPWLLEVERGPTFFRMFDGERENNPVFPQIADMTVFPLGDDIADTETAARRAEEIETGRLGKFIPVFPSGV